MPAGWPATTAICLMLWLIRFTDMECRWRLPRDAAAQAADEHAAKGNRGKGSRVIDPRTIGWPANADCAHRRSMAAAWPLSISGREIARSRSLVAAGLSNRQIADRLVVSVRTVEGHLYRIFGKLGISTRDQLIHLLSLDRTGT